MVKLLLALHIDDDKRGKPERNDWQPLEGDADYNLALDPLFHQNTCPKLSWTICLVSGSETLKIEKKCMEHVKVWFS